MPGNVAKKFGCEKLTGWNLTGKCVAGLEHFEIPKQVIKIFENDAMWRWHVWGYVSVVSVHMNHEQFNQENNK
jgi:hypothetical protein